MGAADNININQIRDLTDRVNHPDVGGFTVKSHGETAGDVPQEARDSYVHALPQYGINNIPHPARGEDLQSFSETRSAPLHQPNRFFGGWYDQDNKTQDTPTGTVSLDVVQARPRTTAGLARASFDAVAGGEEAIGVLDKAGKYAGDIDPYQTMADAIFYDQPVKEQVKK